MTPSDLESITADYYKNMAALTNVTLSRGKFAWQLFYTGGPADSVGSTGPRPLVHAATCAADLRALCNATSPAQTRTLMYGFEAEDPAKLDQFEADLANFLLIRGPYAYLGCVWMQFLQWCVLALEAAVHALTYFLLFTDTVGKVAVVNTSSPRHSTLTTACPPTPCATKPRQGCSRASGRARRCRWIARPSRPRSP